MATTTTLKLPENLKKRIAPLAESAGKTPHAWMVEALKTHATLAVKHKALVADALAAEEEVKKTGVVYRAGDAHRYIRARSAEEKPTRLKLVKWKHPATAGMFCSPRT